MLDCSVPLGLCTQIAEVAAFVHRSNGSAASHWHEGLPDMSQASLPSSAPAAYSDASLRERFERLAKDWREQSRHLSNTAQIAMLKPYQRIIGLGMPVVPLILGELQREPDQWFWALEAITEEDPVPPTARGKVSSMAQAWIDWGKEHGHVAK